jgi:protein disulfide-isomerase
MSRIFVLLLSCLFTASLHAVELGATLQAVIDEKGEPTSRMQMGDTTLLNYADLTVKLKEGKVVSVKEVTTRDSAVRTTSRVAPGQWTTSYSSAMTQAQEQGRNVLLYFTGSDWCGWCKKLSSEVLSQPEFLEYAGEKLVLVKLDFPQEIPQSAEIKEQNRILAKQHGIEGYPTLVLVNPRGKVLGRLGYQPGGARPFVNRLKRM